MNEDYVIIIGSGLSGLVAAHEITKLGKKVMLFDQETEINMGGQAYWSFGGLFFINSPLQRRMGVKDSYALGMQDWKGTAGFDREEDFWPRKWADAYVKFATFDKFKYVTELGLKFFPIVGWAERGAGCASGHGNSVPRFHVTWGTGPAVVKPFVDKAYEANAKGLLVFKFRHRVNSLLMKEGVLQGVEGDILAPDYKARGEKTNRDVIAKFKFFAKEVVIASGGIGANFKQVKLNWPSRLGKAPKKMICGVPDYVDGKMIKAAEKVGVRVINKDRMWHYTEGVKNWKSIWSNHGIRILPGPSSIWLDAKGKRFPSPFYPGFDTLGTLKYIQETGYEYSWFILTQKIIKKEFALSGSEQNPDLTNKDLRLVFGRLFGKKATKPVEDFKEHGEDFIVADNLQELVGQMNSLVGNNLLNYENVKEQIEERDRELENKFGKDIQMNYLKNTRRYLGDKLARTAKPHKILDSTHGPLIAVRLHLLSRKTLGGIETNLNGEVFNIEGEIIKGLYAIGEAAGFGGGGVHGYRALEGTFLGGCIFTGKTVGEYIGKK